MERSNTRSNMEVAKPQGFDRETGRVREFIMACRLYLRMRIRGAIVEEQIQWVLSCVQERLADVWKENILEDLETEEVEFGSVEEFLLELKKEFGREDEEAVKVAELRRLKQGGRTIEEFV